MTEFVDVALVDAVRLPYVPGAQFALAEVDVAFAAAWDALAAAFPGISLEPLFDALPVEDIAAITDAARQRSGEEPPDLFAAFTIPVEDGLGDVLAAAAAELPFVLGASRRPRTFPAGVPLWGSSAEGERELQILPSPDGVDAVWAWHVPGGTAPGVRIADVETAWDLNHEELRGSRISIVSLSESTFDIDHGTAVAGIVVGADDGVGITGIAPAAELLLVTDSDGLAVANAVLTAILAVGVDGVVLLEQGAEFNQGRADVPVELDPQVQRVIRLAALFGITVVEPAGNGGVDLDAFPAFAHFNPLSPTFVDSHAVVVGAGRPIGGDTVGWQRAEFSSFGGRVDCFGPGVLVRAPTVPDGYQDFAGTSAASAVIAGVAASIQGMAAADSSPALDALEMRGLFRDPEVGTQIPDGQPGAIGTIPDLRKIALRRGWPRVVTPAIVALDGSSALAAFLDTENRLVRRTWQFFLGWSDLDPVPPDNFTRAVTTGRPVVTVRQEQDPIARLVHDALMVGATGLEHVWWDDQGQTGILQRVADRDHVAQGSTIAATPTGEKQLAVATVSPEGRLLAMVGDAGFHLIGGLTSGVPLDPLQRYRRLRGPAIASRTPGTADVVAIDDAGTARWFTGVTDATIGTGFQPGVDDTSGVAFDGGPGVDVVAVGPEDARRLVALAVGRDGHLRALDVDPALGGFTSVFLVGPADVSTDGPVALGVTGDRLVALAVDTGGTLLAATRAVDGGPWSDLLAVGDVTVMPSAGVVATSMADIGVMALVADVKGSVIASHSRDGVDWVPFEDVSE